MMTRWLVVILLLMQVMCLKSQLPANLIGSNPHSQRWSQINTNKFQVVFPNGQESSGLRVAQLIDYLWDYDTISIGSRRDKVSIFLQGERTIPNGLVTVGPYRSEFYQTPPQFANSTAYLDLLTIHEYRHIQQFNNASQGITKLVRNVLGSWAWGGMMGLAMPRWYFEGDAVVAETAFSKSGRGRLPSFNMQYYALYEDGRNYNYEKAGAGSLRDYVPDWYPLGYNMLTYGRQEFGDDLWHKVADDAANYKGLFVPFAKGIRRHTGLSTQQLYQATIEDGVSRYQEMSSESKEYRHINVVDKPTVTNYTSPVPWKGSVIVDKSGFDAIGAFYRIDPDGAETKIVEHGILIEGSFNILSFADSKICWAELGFDPRWRHRQYSNIYTYDLRTNQKIQLTKKSKYFSPSLNHDASKIVTVEINADQKNEVVVIDAKNGKELSRWPNDNNYLLTHPIWISPTELASIAIVNEESYIVKIDIESGSEELVLKAGSHQIAHLSAIEDYVYFSAGFDDISDIYRLSVTDGSVERMTRSKVGAFHPSINEDGDLYFMEFSADGFGISKLPQEEIDPQQYDLGADNRKALFKSLEDEGYPSILDDLPEKDFEIQKYSKWSGLLKPHSILPQWNDPLLSISVLSDNKFSTMSAEAGATFNYNEDQWTYAAGLTYAELYPIINASVAKGYRSALLFNFQGLTDSTLVQSIFIERWSENRATAGVTIPYNFSKGNMSNNLSLRANYQYAKLDIDGRINDENTRKDTILFNPQSAAEFSEVFETPLEDGSISTMDLSLSFSMIQRTALQHIQPRLGVVLFSRYRKNIANNDLGGDVFVAGANLFLPGIARTHNFYVNAFYQKESMLDKYRYGDVFNYPRGYNLQLRRDDYFKLGFNYSFPIAYPDLALGGAAFLKRIKANAFYDIGSFGINSFPFQAVSQSMSSAGLELSVDFRALRLVEVDLGVRWSYLMDEEFTNQGKRHQFDFFVLSITQ